LTLAFAVVALNFMTVSKGSQDLTVKRKSTH
jgi:hypothetical protein